MASDSKRDRLPFEPGSKRKKSTDARSATPDAKAESRANAKPAASASSKAAATSRSQSRSESRPAARPQREPIPEAVSRRMIARIGAFSGTPTIFGVLSLVGSYFVVTREWFPLPSVAVLLVSMGFFGLGVLGVTYGALSASWDEYDEGTPLGWKEFKVNLARVRESFRSAGESD